LVATEGIVRQTQRTERVGDGFQQAVKVANRAVLHLNSIEATEDNSRSKTRT